MMASNLQLRADRFSDRKAGHPNLPAAQILLGAIVGDSRMKHRTLCECGCGKTTSLATKTDKSRGAKKGQPVRFIVGHGARKKTIPISFIIEKDTGCWIWQGSKISTGYGNLRVNGKYILAHRYMYELVKGEIPDELELDHLCRNHLCINPAHLEPVTHAENCRRGIKAKLSHKVVEEIKELKKNHQSTAFIADYYNVDIHTINSVLNGKAWS